MSIRTTIPTFPGGSSSIFSSSLFGGGSSFDPYAGIHAPSASDLSSRQLLIKYLAAKEKKSHTSFVDRLKHGGGSLLSGALSVLSRPNWAMAEGVKEATEGRKAFDVGDFLKGFKAGGSGDKKTTFGDILRERHILDGHSILRGAAGLGLDVALDPTTYLFGAGVYGKAGKFGLQVGLHDAEKLGARALEGAAAGTARQAGEELALKGLSVKGSKEAYDAASPILARRNLAESVAHATQRAENSKYLELRFGVTKGKSVGLQTPLKIGKSGSERAAKAAHGGLLSSKFHNMLAEVKPGHLDPVGHELEIRTRHLMEQLHSDTWKEVSKKVEPHAAALGEDGMQLALFAAETPGVVKHEMIDEPALEAALKKEGFLGDDLSQARGFVHAWHEATQRMAEKDRQFGVEFKHVGAGDKGIVYVPHIFDRKGRDIVSRSLTSRGSHEASRASGLNYRKAVTLAKEGKLRLADGMPADIALNPMELLAQRARNGAMSQSHAALRDFVRRTYAVPERVFDHGRHAERSKGLTQKQSQLARRQDELSKLTRKHDTEARAQEIRHGLERSQLPSELKKKQQDLFKQIDAMDKGLADRKFTPQERAKKANLHKELYKTMHKLRDMPKGAAAKSVEQKLSKRHAAEVVALKESHAEAQAIKHATIKALEHDVTKLGPKALEASYRKNHEAFHDGLIEVASLKTVDKNGKAIHYRVPAEVHHSISRVERVIKDDTAMQELSSAIGKAMAKWKVLVTVINPGYWTRNTVSDMWNAYISGVPPWALTKYGGQAAKMMHLASKGDPQALAEMRTASQYGILSGLYVGDVKRVAKQQVKGKSPVTKARDFSIDKNAARENWGRLTHYLYRTRREGMHPAFAAEEVRRAHFDYEDLTELERKKFKAFVPFYTWTRKNVPYQLQQIVSRPGRVASYSKAAQESEAESGVKPGEVIGHALDSHPLGFKLGSGYLDPQTGLSDLERIMDPKQLLGMINPAIKLGVELATNRSLYTGQDIDSGRLVPAPGPLATVADALGFKAGQTKRGGKAGPGVSPWIGYAADQLPWTNFLMKQNPIDKSRKGGANPALSFLAGINYTKVDPEMETLIAQIEQRDREDRQVRAARDAGILPEADKRKRSSFQKQIDKIVKDAISRG